MKKNNKLFLIKIFLPTMLVVGIYIFSLFGVIIPTIEKTILERKKEVIKELVNATVDIAYKFHEDEESGILTTKEAQTKVKDIIRSIRYGKNDKDYFWINDMKRVIVMHPYIPEIVGKDMTNVKDANGVALFNEFVDIVKKQKMGFVQYRWQLHDHEEKVIPKLSFVREAPWNWILGTGVYIEDVKEEIAKITDRLFKVSLLIILMVLVILFFTLKQSFKIEMQKRMTENKNKELAKLNITKDRFFSIVAHDLRNPMGHISSFAEILESDLAEERPDLETAREFSKNIRQSVEVIFLFLENLLVWARVQSHKLERKVEVFDLNTIVNENLELLNGVALNKNISLITKLEPELFINSDKNMLSTVFRNLISNAIKFTPNNGEIILSIIKTDKEIKVIFKDNGVGMSSKVLADLFQEDKVNSTDGTEQEKGTGLGLIICRDFVETNGGSIWAESEEGQGSTFTIRIPREFNNPT